MQPAWAHGLSAAPLSAAKHWRCLLANATADDPGFERLREQPRATPRFIDGAMKVAVFHPGTHAFLLDHLIDGKMLADIAQEVEAGDIRRPRRVIDESGGIGLRIEIK